MGGDADIAPAGRLRALQAGLFGLLAALAGLLAYWQVGRSGDLVVREGRQSLRMIPVAAPRGEIRDRAGRVLAGNRARMDVVADLGRLRAEFEGMRRALAECERPGMDAGAGRAARARAAVVQRHLRLINTHTGRHERVDPARLEQAYRRERLEPLVLAADLTEQEAAQLEPHLPEAGAVRIRRTAERWYPHGALAAHVLGGVRRDWLVPAMGVREDGAAPTAYRAEIGRSGLEQVHDEDLRGQPGVKVVRVDAAGFVVGLPMEERPPQPGRDLVLSLDLELQLAAERALGAAPSGSRGAAVVLQVSTGEVLAMASRPTYDLNALTDGLAQEAKARIDREGGWMNRATQALYPPGSSFKPYTMLAGLRAGVLTVGARFECPGYHVVGGRRFACHAVAGHGELSLVPALAQSCNVFAYRVGLTAGGEAVAAEARRFHLDAPSGLALPDEARGMLVPDAAWKQASGRGRWTAGDTANLAIGQGDLRITPLQAACAFASLARGETLTVPTLRHEPGRKPAGTRAPEPLGLDEAAHAGLLTALRAVVESGIGQNAQVPGVAIAGKSGTAQVMRPGGMGNVAWFVAFAPAERPEIAIAVAIEGGQPGVEFAGAEHAAPVVREIVAAYADQGGRR